MRSSASVMACPIFRPTSASVSASSVSLSSPMVAPSLLHGPRTSSAGEHRGVRTGSMLTWETAARFDDTARERRPKGAQRASRSLMDLHVISNHLTHTSLRTLYSDNLAIDQ